MQVKKPLDQDAAFLLSCANSDVKDAEWRSKEAIKDLRAVLSCPDPNPASDAAAFRLAIGTLEGVVAAIASVKEELGRTELSKIPMRNDLPF